MSSHAAELPRTAGDETAPLEIPQGRPNLYVVTGGESRGTTSDAPSVSHVEDASVKKGLTAEQKIMLDQFDAFMRNAEQYSLLSESETFALLREIQAGPRARLNPSTSMEPIPLAAVPAQALREPNDARDRFIKSNLRLPGKFAKGLWLRNPKARRFDIMDLYQEGYFGLEHAIDDFDTAKGFQFSTYASHWINFYMDRAVDNTAEQQRVPVDEQPAIRRLRAYDVQQAADPQNRTGHTKSDEEIQATLRINKQELAALREIIHRQDHALSLDEPIGDDQTAHAEITPGEVPVKSVYETTEETATQHTLSSASLEALNAIETLLSERESALLDSVLRGAQVYGNDHQTYRRIQAVIDHPSFHSRLRKILGTMAPSDEDWRESAACIGQETLYLEVWRGNVKTKRQAVLDICEGCPVRERCLQYFIDSHPLRGRWAGINTEATWKTVAKPSQR